MDWWLPRGRGWERDKKNAEFQPHTKVISYASKYLNIKKVTQLLNKKLQDKNVDEYMLDWQWPL